MNIRMPIRSNIACEENALAPHFDTYRLVALRTKAEFTSVLEITKAFVVEVPSRSASSVLKYVHISALL